MEASTKKSRKIKILVFVCIFLSILLLGVFIISLVNSDISDEELGPSPFQIASDHTDDNNFEYQEFIKIGKDIVGTNEFHKKYEVDTKDPQKEIQSLQDYVEKNKIVFERLKPELFEKLKYPRFKSNEKDYFENNVHIGTTLRLLQYRFRLQILLNNFDECKKNLIVLHKINSELLTKGSLLIDFYILFAAHSIELNNMKRMINLGTLTEMQKLEILSIYQNEIPMQILTNAYHFEIDFIHEGSKSSNIKAILPPKSIEDLNYLPIIYSIQYQKNKSIKMLRSNALNILKQMETPDHKTYTYLNTYSSSHHNPLEFFKGNYEGKKTIESHEPMLKSFALKLLASNQNIRQIFVAQKLLTFKIENGDFPDTLEELKIDSNLYTDIYTDKPFLYSKENGILHCVEAKKINKFPELTTKPLTHLEIQEKLHEAKNDFILYLK